MFKGKIEELGVDAQKEVIKLGVEGLSDGAISDKINEKHNSDISPGAVRAFRKRNKNKSFQVLKDQKNFDKKMAKVYFDTLTQLNTLNAEMWQFFLEIKSNPELVQKKVSCSCGKVTTVQMQSYGALIKVADHLLKQIDHVDKVLGKMKDKNLTVNFNYVDLSKKLMQVFPQIAHEMEKQGIIKIMKKKKLKELS